jgi:hypothetical protein
MWQELDEGAELFSHVWNVSHIPRVAVENPVMHRHAKARIEHFQKFSQSVQPWQFGNDNDGPDNEKKRTCLWLRNRPLLTPTGALDGSTASDRDHKATPGPDRATLRSMFSQGSPPQRPINEATNVHSYCLIGKEDNDFFFWPFGTGASNSNQN